MLSSEIVKDINSDHTSIDRINRIVHLRAPITEEFIETIRLNSQYR